LPEAWTRDVVAPLFGNVDIETKLLAHELADVSMPDYLLKKIPKPQSAA
jgi:hypothetical protein